MTNKEAIERLENLKVKAEVALSNSNTSCEWLKEDVKGTITAFTMAIEALEKADKYRWHDLRKNPDDLPEADGNNESEYVLAMIGTPEWNHYEWAYYNHNTRMWSTSLYEQNVCAWRDVEPFKGEERDD